MITVTTAALPGLDERENAALMKRLGIKTAKGGLRFENSMENCEKDRLLEKADREDIPLFIAADSVEALEESVLYINLWRNRMCEPEELWDVYDAEGKLTGRTHLRREALSPEEYHLCVHVWIQDSRGRFMLTKRSENKSMPGLWESTGGSVTAGEDSFSAALREVEEETGIILEPSAGELQFRYRGVSFHCDVWLFRQDFDLSRVRLLEGETCGVMAADRDKVLELLDNDELVPYEYIRDFLK